MHDCPVFVMPLPDCGAIMAVQNMEVGMSDRKTWKLIFGGVALLILVGAGVTQAAAAPLGSMSSPQG